jgi:thiosulfate dehydrogenase [quinone] large subunit
VRIRVNFAGHGLIRLYVGASQFVNSTAEHLSKSPLPHGLVIGFLYTVPVVEAFVGIALIAGLMTRVVLVVSSVLMIALTIGVTSNQQWDIAGQQLVYSAVLFVLLFLHEYNDFSADRLKLLGRADGRIFGSDVAVTVGHLHQPGESGGNLGAQSLI